MTATTIEAPPRRNREQQLTALRKANETRSMRAALKGHLKERRVKPAALILDPPPYARTMKVYDLLVALPKWGEVKANRLLNRQRISASKTIGGLSQRQRTALVSELVG